MRLRDGVDVPGNSLRLVVMERVPWPRPTVLHAARRMAGGGSAYDDRVVRARLAQAFGRLIRRDRATTGMFVILSAAMPSRLLTRLSAGRAGPPGAARRRDRAGRGVAAVGGERASVVERGGEPVAERDQPDDIDAGRRLRRRLNGLRPRLARQLARRRLGAAPLLSRSSFWTPRTV